MPVCGGSFFESPRLSQFENQILFAFGDMLAIGAMRALTEAGIKVPEQVGVIGATGLPEAEQCAPTLSVITQPMEQIGREVAHMLIQMDREGVTRLIGRRIRGHPAAAAFEGRQPGVAGDRLSVPPAGSSSARRRANAGRSRPGET